MKEFVFGPKTLSRLHEGSLSLYIDSYLELLHEQGFAQESAEQQIRLVADFSRWLGKNGYRAEDVNPEKLDPFLKRRYRHHRPIGAAALRRLIDLLSRMGVISLQTQPTTPCGRLLDKFRLYLTQERALSVATQKNYLPFVRQFLCECFTGETIDFSQLCAQDVTGFVTRHAQDFSSSHAKNLTKALRSFLRYLRVCGDLVVDLAACVPAVAGRSLSDIPKYLEPDQVERVLDHCNLQTTLGLRDHAILLLLSRLGLRAGEVAFLKMADIDWEAGNITVHGKGGHSAQLPLPADVGKAIATYLQKGRPSCSSRPVFLRAKAPRRGFLGAGAISLIVRRALAQAGIHSQRKGAHLFRHGLATQMLRRGGSLAQIGEILRRRDPNTTAIYAKVDLAALRTLALPWPGGEP